MTAERGFTIELPPPPVGYYSVGETYPYHFAFTSKPTWWHRFWTRVFLGWRWTDARTIVQEEKVSTVWKSWEIRDKPRGAVRRAVTVESNPNVDHGARYILICDPSLDNDSDWLSLSLSQAQALLVILPEAIACADAMKDKP